MNGKRVLLVGCGELGSRHLQAIASLKDVAEIHVVDPSDKALELGQKRVNEVPDLNKKIVFSWSKSLDERFAGGDLCLVITQAKGRAALIRQVAEKFGYRNFLIEKIVTQSMSEYLDLLTSVKNNDLKVWVNCKARTYSIHKYIKSKLKPAEPFIFTRVGGNLGLATNGIHGVDLFVYFADTKKIISTGENIDEILHSSKRGSDLFELSGTLNGVSTKGSQMIISFISKHLSPDIFTIISPRYRFIVDHFRKVAYESKADSKWSWEQITIDENWLVSHMSKKFASDILNQGNCELPLLRDCLPAHEFILGRLLPHFNRLLGKQNNFCPVT